MQLATLQHQFLQAISGAETSLTEYITLQAGRTPVERLHIYRRNTQGTYRKTLQAIYPMTCGVLGASCFQTLARHYVRDHPATHWNLNQYGASFPAYLANPPDAFHTLSDLPYLVDLSQLELLLHQAYYAADVAPFPVNDYAALTATEQARVRLQLAPEVGLMQTSWPIYTIWQHWQQQGSLPTSLSGLQSPDALCIHRVGLQPQVSRVSLAAYQLLTRLEQYCLAELATQPDVAPAMPDLPDYIARGWVSCFIAGNRSPSSDKLVLTPG
jgi:hypothetical protein